MSSNQEPQNPIPDPEAALLAEIEAIVEAVSTASTQFVPQRKRFNRALADLGLLELLGTEWLGLDDDTVTFHGIHHRRLDALVRRLEDIAAALPVVLPVPGSGQLEIPFEPVPSAPSTQVSAHHLEVR